VHGEDDTPDRKLMFPEDDESLAWALPPEEWDDDSKGTSSESEDSPTEGNPGDRAVDQPGKPTEEREDAWLAGVQYSPDRPGVCFQFARESKCDRLEKNGHCEYSHHPDDVARFKAAKLLGQDGVKKIARNMQQKGTYDKTHSESGPRPPSEGSKPTHKRPPGAYGAARRS